MKVSEYHKQGLKWWTDALPAEVVRQAQVQEGPHRLQVFLLPDGTCRWQATRRCRKLMAIADWVCDYYNQHRQVPSIEAILEFFSEERDKTKMTQRAQLVLKAFEQLLADGA